MFEAIYTHTKKKKKIVFKLHCELNRCFRSRTDNETSIERLHEERTASAFYSRMKRQLEIVSFCSETVNVTRLCSRFTPSSWAAEWIFSAFHCVTYRFPGVEQEILKYRSCLKKKKKKKVEKKKKTNCLTMLHLHNRVLFQGWAHCTFSSTS